MYIKFFAIFKKLYTLVIIIGRRKGQGDQQRSREKERRGKEVGMRREGGKRMRRKKKGGRKAKEKEERD